MAKPIKSAGRRGSAKPKRVQKPKSAKQVAKVRHLKAMRLFGGDALRVIAETPEPGARSLSLELLKGIARGSAISRQPWDGKLVQNAAREALTLIGEVW